MVGASTFTTNGKEVLLDGLHFADGRSHKAAEQIVAGLTDRASIITFLESEARNKKRSRVQSRALRLAADNIRAGMDRDG